MARFAINLAAKWLFPWGTDSDHMRSLRPLARAAWERSIGRDTRLGRDVAVKVSDQRFGERFEREARVISSLNHPNICHLYDVGDNYLVMELVEGQTLSARIKEGPIPLDESLAIAKQIADALEAAHEKGIVHRDLKPGNVMIKEDGSVKVLDFGLAKVARDSQSASDENPDPELSPTISMAATQAGVILGTAAYMAPEQAKGKPVDKRADIWAFGVVLHEMVTGSKLFKGEDLTETLAAVVMKEPNLSAAPVELQPLLKKCLAKDPRKRLRDIGGMDALLDLGKAQAAHAAASPGQLPWPALAGGVVVIGLLAWWVSLQSAPEPPTPKVVRTSLELDDFLAVNSTIAISPDGSTVAYAAADGIHVWPLDSFESRLLVGTRGGNMLFFSPDGQQIGYVDANIAGSLKRISVNGGPSGVILDEVSMPLGARWMEDGTVLVPNLGQGILSVPATGGEPTVIVEEPGVVAKPQLVGGGDYILFSKDATSTNAEVVLQDLRDGTRRTLALGTYGSYLDTGHLVFWSNSPEPQLLAVALDEDYVLVGSPIPMLRRVFRENQIPRIAISDSGSLAYQTGSPAAGLGSLEGIRTLTWLDRNGKETPLPAPPDNYDIARISPDGERIAMEVGNEIWVWSVRNNNFARMPSFGEPVRAPTWTPDGQRIVFVVGSGDRTGLYSISADGSGDFQEVYRRPAGAMFPSGFTPDGSELLIAMDSSSGFNEFALPIGEDGAVNGEPRLMRDSETPIVDAAVDPTGQWMVYTALITPTEPAMFFSPYPDAGRQQIRVGQYAEPVWGSKDLLYVATAGDGMSSIDVDTGNGLKLGTPELFIPATGYYWGAEGRSWDLAPDGRFLMMKNAEAPTTTAEESKDNVGRIRVVVNWIEEVKRLVPLR